MENNKTLISAIIVIVVIIIIGAFVYTNRDGNMGKAELVAVRVEKPNIILDAKGLDAAEVWAIPTGTAITESDYQELGDATLTNSGEDTQRWIFQIPATPVSVTEVFVKGFDENGNEVGRLSLDTKGAAALGALLWPITGVQSDVKLGVALSAEGITVRVMRIIEDSRCPSDVQCIQAGRVVVGANVTAGDITQSVQLSTDKPTMVGVHIISLVAVKPDRVSTVTPKASDYVFTISVAEDTKG